MKPVFQTRFGNKTGNCFSACLASILEIPLESIDFFADAETWLTKTNDALRPLGFYWLEVSIETAKVYPFYRLDGAVCVFTGKSPRGEWNHAVVGQIDHDEKAGLATFSVLHDPNPDGGGLDGDIKLIGFPVLINPAKK